MSNLYSMIGSSTNPQDCSPFPIHRISHLTLLHSGLIARAVREKGGHRENRERRKRSGITLKSGYPHYLAVRISLTRSFVYSQPNSEDTAFALFLSFPSSTSLKVKTFVINTLIALAALDFTLFPYFDAASDVVFSRVGAVYPDAVKITVRYPAANATENAVQLLWRKASDATDVTAAEAWMDGPVLELNPSHDWANTTKLVGLWPNTEYECMCTLPVSFVQMSSPSFLVPQMSLPT